MPAASEPPTLPRTWRPLGPLVMGIVLLVGLFGLSAMTWFTFSDKARADFSMAEKVTMAGFAIGIIVLVHALTRSRVEARAEKLIVVNGYRRREFAWAQVVAVSLPPGAPWVTLDLADGNACPAMGIQASDGSRARRAVRDLRAIVEQEAS